jgi:FSR family fosmidomycin resistance protein-like MFS transporter
VLRVFLLYAIVLSVVQAFAPEAARHLHDVPLPLVAMCLTIYMVCSAGGMVLGGFLASDPARCERIVGAGFGVAAAVALLIGLGPLPGMAGARAVRRHGLCLGHCRAVARPAGQALDA